MGAFFMPVGTKAAPVQGETQMKTQFSRRYLDFRALLKNDGLQMFQQTLRILAHRGIEDRRLMEVRAPDGGPKFSIYVYRQGDLLSLLGGHGLRKSEPSAEFLQEMRDFILALEGGRGLA
jgi:hypothetical protein